jgi:protein arginine phosphatase
MKRILFVCTGNTCRSPLAEGLMRKLAHEAGLHLEVRSAGVHASDGSAISHHSAAILRERGTSGDLTSSALKSEHINWADLILTMTAGHKGAVLQRFPQAIEKTYVLKEYAFDGADVMEAIEERERLVTELQLKLALSQEITSEERARLERLEREIPNFDIGDPYGGSLEMYRRAAAEIESGLRKLIERLRKENERNY